MKKAIGIAVCILILPFIVNIPDAKRVKFNIGDWQVTEVNGALVKAKPFNAVDDNPPKVNMRAVIHLSPGPVHAGEMPVVVPGSPSSGARGKVIMLRGQDVTIQLDKGQPGAAEGDIVELSFSAAGEVIPVGTWRVSVVKRDGIVEAKPLDPKGKPNIGMDAQITLDPNRPKTKRSTLDSSTGEKSQKKSKTPPVDAAAIYKEALKYHNGNGVQKDEKRAFRLFKEAGEMGHASAQVFVGYMYSTGKGVKQDYHRAVELYKQACDGGNARGCGNLGWMLYQGRGMGADQVRGRKLMEKACKMGNQWSCDKLKEFGK